MILVSRWATLTQKISPTPDDLLCGVWGDLLLRLYSSPGRHYHALRHLEYVFTLLDEHRAKFAKPVQAELALWFHDAIYAVPSQRNEERSAELCGAFLASVGAVSAFPMAPAMILATKHDGAPCADPDTALVLDIDLAGFARPWDEFNADNERIRREFSIYDEASYRAGRVKFLRGLLARGPIFRVLTDLEAPARANIERHIADLES
jgi:predicted metal-dependent HD superfamily phosphohydrolase